jgi:hypothetical protein
VGLKDWLGWCRNALLRRVFDRFADDLELFRSEHLIESMF